MRSSHVVTISRFALALGAALLVACSGGHGRDRAAGEGANPLEGARGGTLSVRGSDTMVILSQRWAEGFMAAHPGDVVEVSGGGSGAGVSALIAGTADLTNASRPMNDRERATLARERHAEPHETRVALDALAVYVHADNPIASLTVEQLAGIYRGQITSWAGVGGPDGPIVLYSRENNSGTYAYFKEHVLGGADFAVTAQTLPGTAAVINAVAHDRLGIGYGGIGYARGVRAVPVAGADGIAVEPTLENATTGRYPLARSLLVYTAGEPTGLTAEFIAFVLSEPGQALVERAGFYPLPHPNVTSAEAATATRTTTTPAANTL